MKKLSIDAVPTDETPTDDETIDEVSTNGVLCQYRNFLLYENLKRLYFLLEQVLRLNENFR